MKFQLDRWLMTLHGVSRNAICPTRADPAQVVDKSESVTGLRCAMHSGWSKPLGKQKQR